jgi:oligosaccharyltransferase complex subunit delta (ribophorin II)
LRASKPIEASIVIGSFGSSKGYDDKAFSLALNLDPNVPLSATEKPSRYGKLPEIHHIFRADPKSPNILISLFFTIAVLATLPILLGTVSFSVSIPDRAKSSQWLYLGANLNHLTKAFQDAPIAHILFYGSIVSIEGVFFMYYTSWNLFKTLPILLAIGTVTFLSGSRALTEVQERRHAGLR